MGAALHDAGFGGGSVFAAQPARPTEPAGDVDVRIGTTDDLDAIAVLSLVEFDHRSTPPIYAHPQPRTLDRAWMDDRRLAPSTVDRRLSTVCGYYRFAHIDGRINSNPAQYVRRPRVHPSAQRGMDRGELAEFLYTAERPHRCTPRLACCSA